MWHVGLYAMAQALPGRPVSTAEICRAAYPSLSGEQLVDRTGIHTRWWSDVELTHAQLGTDLLRRACDAAGMYPRELARIIFVSSEGGDYRCPATANSIAAGLGHAGTCDAFDINNACMGFLTAVDLAARTVITGDGPVGIAVVDLVSRCIAPSNPRSFAVFGDAAAAAIVGPARCQQEGVLASYLRNDGTMSANTIYAHQLAESPQETVRFGGNREMVMQALCGLESGAKAVLDRARLDIAAIDHVVVHQPNGKMLDSIIKRLGLRASQVTRVVDSVGSVASSSMPLSFAKLIQAKSLAPGQLVLFVGVGAGVSFGALLYRVGQRGVSYGDDL